MVCVLSEQKPSVLKTRGQRSVSMYRCLESRGRRHPMVPGTLLSHFGSGRSAQQAQACQEVEIPESSRPVSVSRQRTRPGSA